MVNSTLQRQSRPHISHVKGGLPLSIQECLTKLRFIPKLLSHSPQKNRAPFVRDRKSPVSSALREHEVRPCAASSFSVAKLLPHVSHENEWSVVWDRLCSARLPSDVSSSSHTSHFRERSIEHRSECLAMLLLFENFLKQTLHVNGISFV